MNEKKRWKVKIKNAKECRIELSFPDLQVRFSNGYSLPLKVAEGEEILMDLLDPEDIRKSWLVGSLKGYLSNDWIESFIENPTIKEPAVPISQFITEQMVLAPKPNLVKPEVPKQLEGLPPPQPNLPEVVKIEDKVFTINEQITDLTLVKSFEDFNKLSHMLKLRWIKETNNIELLRRIQSQVVSSQISNNIQLRLSQIKI